MPVIDQDFLIDMLHIAASVYDIEAAWPSGQGEREIWWKITESENFKTARRAIRSRM